MLNRDRIFSQYLSFSLSVSYHRCSIPWPSLRFLLSGVQFRFQAITLAICCGKCWTGTGFSPITSLSPCQYHTTIVPSSFIHLSLKSLVLFSWQSRHMKHFTRYPLIRCYVLTATDRYRRLLTCTDSLRHSWLENLKNQNNIKYWISYFACSCVTCTTNRPVPTCLSSVGSLVSVLHCIRSFQEL